MTITVRYSGQARQAAGLAEERVDINSGATLHDLIATLATKHGEVFATLLLNGEKALNSSLLIFVDDEQVFPSEPNSLQDGEVVEIMSPIAGG